MVKMTLCAALIALLCACGPTAEPKSPALGGPRDVTFRSGDAPRTVTFPAAMPTKGKKTKRSPEEARRAMSDKLSNRFAKLSMAELRETIELAQLELGVREENADTGSIPAELLDETRGASSRDCR